MIIIPAIDIIEGKVVRLRRGEFDKKTIYSDDPVETALSYQEQGAGLIHVVDLDGARKGEPVNTVFIEKITSVLNIPVQTGGGLRTMDSVKAVIEKGVFRVVIGSAALQVKEFLTEVLSCYGDKIAVGIDARNGLAAIDGWTTTTPIPAIEAVQEMAKAGVKTAIFTDISADGTLSGPNLKALSEVLSAVGAFDISVIASGGISSLDDLKKLKDISPRPPDGVIIGRALYEGKIDLKEAITAITVE